jgi:hypothetical protein
VASAARFITIARDLTCSSKWLPASARHQNGKDLHGFRGTDRSAIDSMRNLRNPIPVPSNPRNVFEFVDGFGHQLIPSGSAEEFGKASAAQQA